MNPWLAGVAGAVPVALAGTAAWGAMHPSSQLFGPTVRRAPQPNGRRAIALTFDDGPNRAITLDLVRLLERQGARATFFVIGRYVRECGDLLREIAGRGHAVGNHTETHPNLVWMSRARIREELCRCEEAIGGALGEKAARWIRPPFGLRGPQLDGVVRRAGLLGVVMWSVICYDWKPQPPERLVRRLGRVRPGDVVVLHDGDHRWQNGERRHMLAALEYWLPRWRDAGIEFVTMDDLPRVAEAAAT